MIYIGNNVHYFSPSFSFQIYITYFSYFAFLHEGNGFSFLSLNRDESTTSFGGLLKVFLTGVWRYTRIRLPHPPPSMDRSDSSVLNELWCLRGRGGSTLPAPAIPLAVCKPGCDVECAAGAFAGDADVVTHPSSARRHYTTSLVR